MDLDIVSDSGNIVSGSVSVLVHPLVVLNISEHWTRNKVKENSTNVIVYGALLGKQDGHHVEIFNSFELLVDELQPMVNAEFYTTREGQCKQIYPDLDIVGWYTTGGVMNEKDESFNRQMQELNESMLILKLDPIQTYGELLPIRVYESVIDNDGKIHFRQVTYTLATDEVERIGIDYVARTSMSSNDRGSSMTVEHLLNDYQAVQMLSIRIRLIRDYVSAVASGELPINRARLREINALIKRLPLISPVNWTDQCDHLCRQANDVCLTALLSIMTQGLHISYSCMVKTAQTLDRRSMHLASTAGAGMMGTLSNRLLKSINFFGNSNS